MGAALVRVTRADEQVGKAVAIHISGIADRVACIVGGGGTGEFEAKYAIEAGKVDTRREGWRDAGLEDFDGTGGGAFHRTRSGRVLPRSCKH